MRERKIKSHCNVSLCVVLSNETVAVNGMWSLDQIYFVVTALLF